MKKVFSTIIGIAAIIVSILLFTLVQPRKADINEDAYVFVMGMILIAFVSGVFILILTYPKGKSLDFDSQAGPMNDLNNKAPEKKESIYDFKERWSCHTPTYLN